MNPKTYQEIIERSPKVAEYAAISGRLRKLAGTIVGAPRRELLAVTRLLEELPEELFRPSMARTYELHRRGLHGSVEKTAEYYGISTTTLKQIMQAMERGGLSVPESRRRRQRIKDGRKKSRSTTKGQGNEATNEGRSNDERIEESIRAIEDAVIALKQKHPDWDSLGVREKIDLLKAETLKQRGAAISSQTLYREWCRDLW